ncbi:hypothetical protein TSUD_169420 [Trifolium subterraneum]|nr:hypothetical protein TSUD_169420 [Trifolium subterraneum]
MALDQPSLPSNTNSVDGESVNGTPPSSAVNGGEDGKPTARLPRWTRQEILVLIQGKSDAESRFKPGRNGSGFGSSEPKWALVSSYCKKHGVNRGPIQCRKRWSNLAGDYKKIKEWESQDEVLVPSKDVHVPSPVPISEKQFLPLLRACDGEGNAQGTKNEKQPASHPEMGSTSQGERKRKRFATDGDEEEETLQSQLIDVLEKNGKMLSEQLEAQNINFQLDRQHQNDTASSIVAVLDKLANALGRIADKL